MGLDRPLWMQAQDAQRAGQPGTFWAAHQLDLEHPQIEPPARVVALLS